MSSDYTAIYNLLEEAASHKEQIKIHEDHYKSLITAAQSKCEHPATMKRHTSQQDEYGKASKNQGTLTYKCLVCHKKWEEGRVTN